LTVRRGERLQTFRVEARLDEAIDLIARPGFVRYFGQQCLDRRDERPVLGENSALFNPAAERFLLFGLKHAVRIRWRHHFRLVVTRNAAPEFALVRMAGDNCRHAVAFGQRGLGDIEP
jgi:hypothetical protein